MKKILLLSFLTLCGQLVFANGYQVLLQGNKEIAMGNVGVGLKPTSTSVFFNPGAMGFLEESEIYLGASVVLGKANYAQFNDNTQYENRSEVPVPSLYAVIAPDSASALSNFRFGIGVFAPFGSIVDWDWRDFKAGGQTIDDLTLVAVYVQPTVSFRINDWLSIGAGLDILANGHVELERNVDVLGEEGRVVLDGKAETKLGYNVGLFAMPSDKFSIGINYRSKIDAVIEEESATFSGFSTNVTSVIDLPTTFNAAIPLPAVLTVGVGLYPTEKLTIGIDVARVGWGAYDSLNFVFDNDPNSSFSQNGSNSRNFEDSYVFHFGAEYAFSDIIAARAGIYYDQSPVQDGYLTVETPDANAIGYTAGLGIKLSDHFDLDASFLLLDKERRENRVPTDPSTGEKVQTGGLDGIYKIRAIIPGFGLRYRF